MKTKLLLINLPCYSTLNDFIENSYQYNPSLGLLAITEYVSIFGFQCHVIDYNYNKLDYYELSKFIEQKEIAVIGVTSYTENLNLMLKVVKDIKRQYKDIKIVVGGPHATLRPEDILKNRFVDYIILKDGESTFLELLVSLEMEELISIENIKGLYYRDNGIKKKNEDRQVISDLNLLPIINRERVDINRYKTSVSLYTSKGCPAKCIYCSASAISGAKYRMRDVNNIFLECIIIYTQVDFETTKALFFIDDTFTVSKKRVQEFCELCIKYDFKMYWMCESRVDVVTDEMIDSIYSARCISIQFGVESGNQQVLNNIKKDINLEHLEHIIDYLKKYNIDIFLSFILGHYCDTKETMMQTGEMAKHLFKINPKVSYGFSINTPFPGTWQYDHAEELGMTIIDRNYSNYNLITAVFNTPNFKKDELQQLYKQISLLYN